MYEHGFSSCPLLYATDFPPLLVGFSESTFTAGKCLLYYTYNFNAKLLMPQRSRRDDFFLLPTEQTCPDWLIVSDVNYRMWAFVRSRACCHDDL